MKDYRYAEIAYDAYVASTGGVSLVTGDKLPPFVLLRQPIKDAWFDAAKAVIDAE